MTLFKIKFPKEGFRNDAIEVAFWVPQPFSEQFLVKI